MGRARHFTYDLELDNPRSPVAGDLLSGQQAVYLIVDARPVESRLWANRWALTVKRIGTRTSSEGPPIDTSTVEAGAYFWSYGAYRRGETPADYFARG